MKKITAFILITVLLLPLASAFADGTTTLTTTVPSATYSLTIPQSVKVEYGVGLVNVETLTAYPKDGFYPGKDVKVTITYTPFTCPDVSTTIPYRVVCYQKSGVDTSMRTYGEIKSGDSLLFKCTRQNVLSNTDPSGEVESTGTYRGYGFRISVTDSNWGKALAGDYSATMTFTSQIVASETDIAE